MFWEYLNRVFELPHAKSIIEWLKTDGMAANLEAELSDSTNFGLAKSMFMSGKNAGYDMTSEKGMASSLQRTIGRCCRALSRHQRQTFPGVRGLAATIPVRVEVERSSRNVAANTCVDAWLVATR